MDNQTLKKFRWFWAWEDEREEAWLRQMSQAGWHVAGLYFPCLYKFRAGAPRDYVYRLDFNSSRSEFQHYVQLFRDAGWEHIMEYGSWQYFRMEVRPGENPEIFTDNASKVMKYRRVLLTLVLVLPLMLMGSRSLIRDLSVWPPSSPAAVAWLIVQFFFLAMFLVFIFATLKLLQRVTQLGRTRQ